MTIRWNEKYETHRDMVHEFTSETGQRNLMTDLNNDGIVNILDLMIVADAFGIESKVMSIAMVLLI